MKAEGAVHEVFDAIRYHAQHPDDSSVRPILLVSGGGMSGIFSASVLSILQEHKLTRGFVALEGVSSGASIVSYFASGNISEALEEIYLGWACQGTLLRPHGVAKRIDGLIETFRGAAGCPALNNAHVREFPAPVYVSVAHADTGAGKLVDIRHYHDPFGLLHASMSVPILCPPVTLHIHNRDDLFVDGGVGTHALPLRTMSAQHHATHALVLMNYNPGEIPFYARLAMDHAVRQKHITPELYTAIERRHRRIAHEIAYARRSTIPTAILWAPKLNPFNRRPAVLRKFSEQAKSDLSSLMESRERVS